MDGLGMSRGSFGKQLCSPGFGWGGHGIEMLVGNVQSRCLAGVLKLEDDSGGISHHEDPFKDRRVFRSIFFRGIKGTHAAVQSKGA